MCSLTGRRKVKIHFSSSFNSPSTFQNGIISKAIKIWWILKEMRVRYLVRSCYFLKVVAHWRNWVHFAWTKFCLNDSLLLFGNRIFKKTLFLFMVL